MSILRTAITWTRPTLHLCHKQSRLYYYFPLAFQTPPPRRPPPPPPMIAGLRPRHCSWRVCAAIACHNNTHYCDVCFFRFPSENYGDRYDEPMFCPKSYLSLTHPPAVGLRSRCRPLTSVSFKYAPSLPPFMLPFRIIVDIYIIKLRTRTRTRSLLLTPIQIKFN